MADDHGTSSIDRVVRKRGDLVRRLMVALAHLPLAQQYSVVTSWLSVDELQNLVEFQERGKSGD